MTGGAGERDAAPYPRGMAETLDIVPLRTFVAIDDCGGFGRAAVALHLSQPTVSQHVRGLERRLGAPLVERAGRYARFTPAGERLLVEARRILAVHDDAIARLDGPRDDDLMLAVAETSANLLPRLLAGLRAAHPAWRVRVQIDRSARLVEAIDRGGADLAIVLDTAGTVPGVELGTVPLRWYAAPGRERPRTEEPTAIVAYQGPCGIRERALAALGHRGRRVEVAAESAGLDGVLAAARAGLGVVALPAAEAPTGLVACEGLPDLGEASVRLLARRGLGPEVATAVTRIGGDLFAAALP